LAAAGRDCAKGNDGDNGLISVVEELSGMLFGLFSRYSTYHAPLAVDQGFGFIARV